MAPPIRVYLTGRVQVERGDLLVDEVDLGGRQARLALAYLTVERARPVSRGELADVLWPGEPPRSWEVALSAVVSNLRRALARADLPRGEVIGQAFGCYQLRLPATAWVDLEAAAESAEQAEAALRTGDAAGAYGWAGPVTSIARRPFLPGEDGAWVEQQRAMLRALLLRGLDCFVEIFIQQRDALQALRAAEEAVALEPFRESGHRALMRAHAAAGNRAEALRAYERCRRHLADELGVDPSPQTQACYLELLRA